MVKNTKGMFILKKLIKTAAVLLALAMMLVGCVKVDVTGNEEKPGEAETTENNADTGTEADGASLEELTANTINGTITLETGETINFELYPDLAPRTVENFVKLADEGFYEGTIFHRVMSGFMIQGGGYDADLNAKEADSIVGEFTENGFTNELLHTRGVMSMARTNDPDSASSQFFIMHADAPHLDGLYAAFGKVTDEESLAVVDSIAAAETETVIPGAFEDVPVTPIVIKSVTIDEE